MIPQAPVIPQSPSLSPIPSDELQFEELTPEHSESEIENAPFDIHHYHLHRHRRAKLRLIVDGGALGPRAARPREARLRVM